MGRTVLEAANVFDEVGAVIENAMIAGTRPLLALPVSAAVSVDPIADVVAVLVYRRRLLG
jgi:hypothetical protein